MIKGQPIRTIQELMGHKDLRMTIRYAHLSPEHLQEAVEDIETMQKTKRLPEGCPTDVADGNELAAPTGIEPVLRP